MYMTWLDTGFFVPLFPAVELLPGESCGARLQASSFVSCMLYVFACIAVSRSLLLLDRYQHCTHHCHHHHHHH
jgi:hypothetical protein